MAQQGRFPSEKLAKYPHMLMDDIPVWERYLDAHASEWQSFDYDVRVGRGDDPGDAVLPPFREMAISLTKLRIDAVGYRASEVCVFEVKLRVSISAFGQIVGYRDKYKETFPTADLVTACVVAESASNDVSALLLQYGVRLELV